MPRSLSASVIIPRFYQGVLLCQGLCCECYYAEVFASKFNMVRSLPASVIMLRSFPESVVMMRSLPVNVKDDGKWFQVVMIVVT
ncbi:hypothetical protein H5410_030865 [Solanum commersonii]|uniref:Uncharacterized protein n=1 Tax=Solanum commersonii TaxID=4109 RepID=A0A9J5YI64_SOLCO|nr:hypothetical protein H5410_030865 [Solanum commersonii]